jgi:hypothetical protein
MPTSLNFDDDENTDAIIWDLERAFDVHIPDAEVAACQTLGDIFNLLLRRFGEDGIGAEACATAMAFHELKHAIAESTPGAKLTPSTRLADISGPSVKQFFITTQARSKLPLPRKARTWMGNLGIAVAIFGIFGPIPGAVLVGGWTILSIPLLIAAGGYLLNTDPGKFPSDCQTLGDLSRHAARLGFGRLARAGAKAGEREIWDVLTTIVAEHAQLPAAEMRPETVLLRTQKTT